MDVIIVFIIMLFGNAIIHASMARKFPFYDKILLNKVFLYHLFFFVVYFAYASFNPSDSESYYLKALNFNGDVSVLFKSGTTFIVYMAYPLVQLGCSYFSVMLFFSWLGYLGFLYAYVFFRENISVTVKVFGRYDLLTLLLFLPNMHFWSASLGKGAVIFMGLMMVAYAVKSPAKRIVPLLIGAFFVYMVRSHMLLFVIVGVLFGVLFGKDQKIGKGAKFLLIVAGIGFLTFGLKTVLGVAQLEDSENLIEDFQQFSTTRSGKLSTSGSGVNMANYPLPFKLFTFWFRPLFVDSPGAIGLFSSFENLIYLLLFAKISNKRFWRFLIKAPYVVKMAALTFLLTSIALTFVMSNLGIIMRQKAQVMYFGFFVIYYFLAYEQEQKRKIYEKEQRNLSHIA